LVLVGQSRDRVHRRWFGAGVAARLLRESHGLEINVLDRDVQPSAPRSAVRRVWVWRHYLLALLATGMAAGLAWAVS
ncbi:hypothetical protein, partial [Pseudomonas sp. UBA2628]